MEIKKETSIKKSGVNLDVTKTQIKDHMFESFCRAHNIVDNPQNNKKFSSWLSELKSTLQRHYNKLQANHSQHPCTYQLPECWRREDNNPNNNN